MIPQTHPADRKWLDRVFEPIADAVGQFAQRHGMRFDKCPIGKKDWVVAGGHPKGGNVILILRYSVIRGLCITGIWQVGCPELSVCHTHARKMRRCRIEPTELTAILEEEFTALLATEYGNWTVTRPIPNVGKTGPTV
jgi:hypothetical protein